jgi:hypothetical protein
MAVKQRGSPRASKGGGKFEMLRGLPGERSKCIPDQLSVSDGFLLKGMCPTAFQRRVSDTAGSGSDAGAEAGRRRL